MAFPGSIGGKGPVGIGGRRMCFVGRQKEMRKLARALEQGRHVIVSGAYGSGRTRLVRHVAADSSAGRRFVFTDFSKTPGEVCGSLLAAFRPKAPSGRPVRSARYRTGRNLLAGMQLPKGPQPVIVLDNLGRLTRQKLSFLRDLNMEHRYLFIAIVESFLTERSLFLLRACLFPSETIALGHLPIRDACNYFQRLAARHGLDVADEDLLALAKASSGYPLGELPQIKCNRRGT